MMEFKRIQLRELGFNWSDLAFGGRRQRSLALSLFRRCWLVQQLLKLVDFIEYLSFGLWQRVIILERGGVPRWSDWARPVLWFLNLDLVIHLKIGLMETRRAVSSNVAEGARVFWHHWSFIRSEGLLVSVHWEIQLQLRLVYYRRSVTLSGLWTRIHHVGVDWSMVRVCQSIDICLTDFALVYRRSLYFSSWGFIVTSVERLVLPSSSASIVVFKCVD